MLSFLLHYSSISDKSVRYLLWFFYMKHYLIDLEV